MSSLTEPGCPNHPPRCELALHPGLTFLSPVCSGWDPPSSPPRGLEAAQGSAPEMGGIKGT